MRDVALSLRCGALSLGGCCRTFGRNIMRSSSWTSGPVECALRSLQMRGIPSFETSGNTQPHCVTSSDSLLCVEPRNFLSLVSVVSHLRPIHTLPPPRFFEFLYLHFFLQVISSFRFLKPKVRMRFAYLPCMLHTPPGFVHPNS